MISFSQILMFFRDPWNVLGSFGQILFASRFLIQWIRSEMEGRSVIPLAFWYCSLGGGLILLSYAVYREEPVFIAGQLPGILVYSRNLYLIFRERQNLDKKIEIETKGTG
jgi:lipid-A-disaccharide synthase-like uncharacterized protein